MPGVLLRQLLLRQLLRQLWLRDGRAFSLCPSFVVSAMLGDIDELEGPLLLSVGIPCWIVTEIFAELYVG